jgi:tRNA nucleotidyltransferase (CCA-adding enzyme)
MVTSTISRLAPREAVRAWLEAHPVWSKAVTALRDAPVPTYLVGGSVRDALRGVPGGDLDVAVDGEALRLGRWLADRLGAAYYVMDAQHDVCRVLCTQGLERCHIDLAGLRGATISHDLRARDLTINAMGMALTDPLGPLLDPTGGREDLARGLIRQAYAQAFSDDPLRMLRTVRLTAGLGFMLDPETRTAITQQAGLIEQVSSERTRDELVLLLDQPSVAGLRLALTLGLLHRVLLPCRPDELARGIAWLSALRAHLPEPTLASPNSEAASCGPEHPLLSRLASQWQQEMVLERTRQMVVALAALLAEADPESADMALTGLKLAAREQAHVRGMLRAMQAELWKSENVPSARSAHRYYRAYGTAGADGAALMAVAVETPDTVRAQAQRLMAIWLDEHERIVAPAPLLSGSDLISRFALTPGPLVGHILAELAEAQAEGSVTDRDQALDLVSDAIVREQLKGQEA